MHTIRMPTSRWQAFLIHLGFSAVLYVVLLYLIVFRWYPQPYFAADGGWLGVQLITGVDLVLGPVLTLIVYKRGKPGLMRDLTLIVMVQTVALVWGTWLVYEQRIATVTYADGSFYTITHEQVRAAGGKAPEVLASSDIHPALAYVRLPSIKKELAELRMRNLFTGGTPLFMLGERYELLTLAHRPMLQAHAIDLERLGHNSEPHRRGLEQFLSKHGGQTRDYLFLPLVARYGEPILALRYSDIRVVDTINIRPDIPTNKEPRAEAQAHRTAHD